MTRPLEQDYVSADVNTCTKDRAARCVSGKGSATEEVALRAANARKEVVGHRYYT